MLDSQITLILCTGARVCITIHQSHVLVNVRFSLINTFAGIKCSATLKGSSFAQTFTRGLGLGTRLDV